MDKILKARTRHRVTTPPQALHIERQELQVAYILDGSRVIQAEPAHVTRGGHGVLGEHHHSLATEQGFPGFIHGRFRMGNIQINSPHLRKQQPHVPLFKRPSGNHKAQRTGASHLDHGPVHIRNVVAHQKHRSFPGNAFHARHQKLVMHREYRTHQLAKQRMGHGHQGPDGTAQAHDSQDKEQAHTVQVQEPDKSNGNNLEEKNTEVLHPVSHRKHVSRRPGLGMVKQHGEHGNHVDAAAESKQGKGNGVIGPRDKGNQENKDGRPGSTHRDEPGLNEVPGHAHGKEDAHHKAQGRTEDSVVGQNVTVKEGARTEQVLDNEYQQEYHDPEHGKPDNGLTEGPVHPKLAQLATGKQQVPITPPRELQFGIVCTDRRQAKTKQYSKQFQGNKSAPHRGKGPCRL